MRRSPLFAVAALALTFASVPAPTRAQSSSTLSERIERIINRLEFRHAMWGIEIYDLDAGKAVYAFNEEKLFTPGSTKTGTFVVGDPLNRSLLITGKGLAGYLTSADGRRLAIAVYVNNVAVSTAPDEVTRVAGQALGEVAAAAYQGR